VAGEKAQEGWGAKLRSHLGRSEDGYQDVKTPRRTLQILGSQLVLVVELPPEGFISKLSDT
jgi:hypothetical protein